MSSGITLQIPEALRSLPQWVAWRWEERNGKPTKPPVNPLTGRLASNDDRSTWGTLEDAQEAREKWQLPGIGFVFTTEDPFTGVDLDKCRNAETDIIEPWAQAIINELDSYTEISPSGKGVHILLSGSLPAGCRRKGHIEMYDCGRYFTVTGNHLPGTPQEILPREPELWAVHAKVFGAIETSSSTGVAANGKTVVLTNEALIQRASAARNGSKFSRLLAGNWTGEFPSQSEADAALCALLAFWTGKDAAQMDSLFRLSGLFRPKWDEVHFSDGRTYGDQTIAEAIALCAESYGASPNGKPLAQARADDRPHINVGIQDLPTLTDRSWEAIKEKNDPPLLFLFGGLPSRLEYDERSAPILRELTVDRLRHEVARAARWIRLKDGDIADAKPPLDVVRDMLASPAITLPSLLRIVETPVFSRNRELLSAPGYHAADGIYYSASVQLDIPPLPAVPSEDQIVEAKRVLLDDLLGDFPFANTSSRAHALACLLLPFVRDLIDGPTPLHLIEKPSPGTGGTLLAEMLVFPATGSCARHLTEARDEDEWRKRLTAVLMNSPAAVCFDNVHRRLDTASLASVLTATVWSDRLLGHTETVHIPVRTTWLANGNNPTVSDEISRRSVPIRLDAHTDRPWLRTQFNHPDLRRWAAASRRNLIHAALVLCLAWIAAGRPAGERTLGRFESWSHVVGGILAHVKVPDFLAGIEQFYEQADPEGQAWLTFVHRWWNRYKNTPVGVGELFTIALPHNDDPLDLGLGDGSERSQRIRLGKQLIGRRDRYFEREGGDQVQIQSCGTRQGSQQWKLVQRQILK